ncbi:MAG: hypothetical protein JWR75_267 [Devosia sp.]|nr:hypothetical protein [Devosia sp.]
MIQAKRHAAGARNYTENQAVTPVSSSHATAESNPAAPMTELSSPVPANDRAATTRLPPVRRARRRWPLALRILLWIIALPIILLLILYVVLLVTPIPLSALRGPAEEAVAAAMPPGSSLELGDMSVALEGGAWPVLRFAPVTFADAKTGAKVTMEALEVGFSLVRTLIGQPGATVTVVGPHLQIQQDLFGPRLASFDVVPDPAGGPPTVRVIEGEDAYPAVRFSPSGISLTGTMPTGDLPLLRSDNDWLVKNMEAAAEGIGQVIDQARLGRFARISVRDGVLDMNDALYGMYRTFGGLTLDLTAGADGNTASGSFAMAVGGKSMGGLIDWTEVSDGTANMSIALNDIDLNSFMPTGDAALAGGVTGSAALSLGFKFDVANNKLLSGIFRADLTGMELQLGGALYPIAGNIITVDWNPDLGEFSFGDTAISIGPNSGKLSGAVRLGLDPQWGPTVAMSIKGSDIVLAPGDLPLPEVPFESMSFSGWAAPLYGAVGIDSFVLRKPGALLATTGDLTLVNEGIGFDMTVAAKGLSADDLKRMWPSMMATDARTWMVKGITGGTLTKATMRFNFPVGSLVPSDPAKPLAKDSMSIEMVADGLVIKGTDTLPPIAVTGETRVSIRDNMVTLTADGGDLTTDEGPISLTDVALVVDSSNPEQRVTEISGAIAAGIPAALALAKSQQPDALANAKLPIDLAAISGDVGVSLVATILDGPTGTTPQYDYVITGTVKDLGSSAPIQNVTFDNGQLEFMLSEEGYRVTGTADVSGAKTDIVVAGALDGMPTVQVSDIKVADLAKFGFDASEFLSGSVTAEVQPAKDGSLGLKLDLTGAGITIKDLGLTKTVGQSGSLTAMIKPDGETTHIEDLKLAFNDVAVEGKLDVSAAKGLLSADLSRIKLSPGDSAQAAISPIDGGYLVRVRGEQLDLKPVLKRAFSLTSGSGGVAAESFKDSIVLDVELKRVLGMYKTTAYNLDLDLSLAGTNLKRVNLQTSFGEGTAISVTTNPGPEGKVMSVAFNDAGTLLRFVGAYANLIGGSGSFVLRTVDSEKADHGSFQLADFAIADEAKLAEIIAGDASSQQLLQGRNQFQFKNAEVSFIRRSDRIEVVEGLLSGDRAGGTLRGFIYTEQGQYDLVGTYVPLFGINTAFQKLLGPLGGRQGEGLFGVTFAVRGPLDKPDFRINPVSALAIGPFRRLFEFKAKEQPRVE